MSIRTRQFLSAILSPAWLRWLLLLSCLLLLAGASQRAALAHALLVRSEPEANAELTSSPPSVEMWFSEPLEDRFSHARLIDSLGEDVAGADSSLVDVSDPSHLSLPLSTLQPGIYTVVWTTLSSVDGHEWVGSFPLTLLNPDGSRPASATPMPVTGGTDEIPSPLKGAARWFSLLGAILLTGCLLFREMVARPVLVRQPLPGLAEHLVRAGRLLGIVGVTGVLIGGWLQIGAQVAALGAVERIFDLLVSTQPGRLVLVRQLLLLPVVALLVTGESPDRWGLRPSLAGRARLAADYLIGLVLLLTFSLASHAAAVPGRGWAVAGDFVHLLAAAAWMGGLLNLALLFWLGRGKDEQSGLGLIVRGFSLLAAGAVFVLTVTGLFSSAVQLPTAASLWTTTYGLLLLGKIGLVALALAVAFFNNRAAQRDDTSTSAGITRRVGIEALVSLALLLVVALLVQTPPPPRPQPYVAPALPFSEIQQANDLLIHLKISPNQPGSNRFWTHLYHPDTSPIGEVQLVRLFFAPKKAELGQARTNLPTEGDDIYVDEGAWMSQPGEWDVTVYVRRRGMDDATAQFSVTLPPSPGSASLGTPWQNPAAALPFSSVSGAWLLAIGLTPFLWWKPLRRRSRDAAPLLGGMGLACLIVGLVLIVQGVATSQEQRVAVPPAHIFKAEIGATPVVTRRSVPSTPDPLAPTPTPDDSFLAGAEIFQAQCVQCHGPRGMGDGPAAATLPVQPAILPFHIPLHPDEDVYVFISEGFPNLGMPAFQEILSQDEILQVLRYIRVRFGGAVP